MDSIKHRIEKFIIEKANMSFEEALIAIEDSPGWIEVVYEGTIYWYVEHCDRKN